MLNMIPNEDNDVWMEASVVRTIEELEKEEKGVLPFSWQHTSFLMIPCKTLPQIKQASPGKDIADDSMLVIIYLLNEGEVPNLA